jgi:GT2 family glycosyltransferase
VISAVVVTYDSAACVVRCIASVQDALPHAEIVVVDKGSRDETVNAIRGAVPPARVIEGDENVGFGRACNTAPTRRGSFTRVLRVLTEHA